MAPINIDDGATIDIFPMSFIAALLISTTLTIFVIICGCCGQKKESMEKMVEPESPAPAAAETANEQKADEQPEKQGGMTSPTLANKKDEQSMPKIESDKNAPKKEFASSPKSSLKNVSTKKQQSTKLLKSLPKTIVATQQQKSQIQTLTAKAPPENTKLGSLVTGQEGSFISVVRPSVVSGYTAAPGTLLETGGQEPTYPVSQAVEYENPAYDTIGPEEDDPFYKASGGASKPQVVAELVHSRKPSSQLNQKAKTPPKGPISKSPTSSIAKQSATMDPRSAAVSVGGKRSVTAAMAYPTMSKSNFQSSVTRKTTLTRKTAVPSSTVVPQGRTQTQTTKVSHMLR